MKKIENKCTDYLYIFGLNPKLARDREVADYDMFLLKENIQICFLGLRRSIIEEAKEGYNFLEIEFDDCDGDEKIFHVNFYDRFDTYYPIYRECLEELADRGFKVNLEDYDDNGIGNKIIISWEDCDGI